MIFIQLKFNFCFQYSSTSAESANRSITENVQKNSSFRWMDTLPDEILIKIFTYLDQETLLGKVRNVCERWREASENCQLWRRIDTSLTSRTRELVKYFKYLHHADSILYNHYKELYNGNSSPLRLIANNCPNLRSFSFIFA